MKTKRGISLLNLIVTIVILTILSGTVIVTTGKTKILSNVQEISKKWNDKAIGEKDVLTDIDLELAKQSLGENELLDDEQYLILQPFITAWEIATENEELIMPFVLNKKYNCTIDYGDGTRVVVNQTLTENITHTYANPGKYEIKITGTMPSFSTTSVNRDKLIGLKQWGVVNCTQFSFSGCANLVGGIPEPSKNSFNKLTAISFSGCTNLSGQISEKLFANPGNLKSLTNLFASCTSLESVPANLLINCVNIINVSSMFYNCTSLTQIPAGFFKNCSKITNAQDIFRASGLTQIPADLFDINKGEPNGITNMIGAFADSKITSVPAGLFDTCTSATSFCSNGLNRGLFQGCRELITIPDNLFANNTKAKDFTNLFRWCSKLNKLPANLFGVNSSGTNLQRAFDECSAIETIENGFILPQNTTTLNSTFQGCGKLKYLPNSFKIPDSVTDLTSTFKNTGLKNLPNNFEIPSGVTKMGSMFYACRSLTSLPDSFRIPSGVTNLDYLFWGCGALKTVPQNFALPEGATNLKGTFRDCKNLVLPENFVIPEKVTNMTETFLNCYELTGTIVIKATPTSYGSLFNNTARNSKDSILTVNYTETCTNIDELIATKTNENVQKGTQI